MQRITRLFRQLSFGITVSVLIGVFVLIVLWDIMVYTVPVGHAGVVWHRLFWSAERTSQGPKAEGLHIILPWDKFYIYDLRLQVSDQSYNVVSNDGLHFDITLTFRWRAISDNVVTLNKTIGPDYLEKLLVPEVGSVAREVIAHYSAEALFTEKRSEVQALIYENVTSDDLPNGIGHLVKKEDTDEVVVLTDILIKKVELPAQIKTAIQNKLEQAQIAKEYEFRVEREKLEAERKRVEAEGIKVFQETVSPAISESYLRWRGIEATLRLAQSPNAKVVVIGNNKTGLPLILDTTTQTGLALPAQSADGPDDLNTSLEPTPHLDQGSLEPRSTRTTPQGEPDPAARTPEDAASPSQSTPKP